MEEVQLVSEMFQVIDEADHVEIVFKSKREVDSGEYDWDWGSFINFDQRWMRGEAAY
jgi:hypothetical protein